MGTKDELKSGILPGSKHAKHMLLACFLLLGMGLLAFSAATLQAADYYNSRYKGMYTPKVVNICYTGGFMVAMVMIFFGGPDLWPNKRARMMYGYMALLCALVLPALIDGLVSQLVAGAPGHSLRAALAPWAVGAAVAGAADATVASVLNGEAAALGCNKAAAYGKPAGGVLMAVLRITIKAALPAAQDDVDRLCLGVNIHIAVAAVILLACVLVTAYVIPYLVDQVQQAESPEVPPGLTFQQTLNTAYTAMEGGPQGEAAAASLQSACSLAPMLPAMDSTFGLPLLEVRREPTDHGISLRVSKVQNNSLAGNESFLSAAALQQLPSAHGRFNPHMRQSMVRRNMAQQAGTCAERPYRHSSNSTSPVGCRTPASISPVGLAAAAPARQRMRSAHARSMRRQLSNVLGRHTSQATTRSRPPSRTPPASGRPSPPPSSNGGKQLTPHDADVVVPAQQEPASTAVVFAVCAEQPVVGRGLSDIRLQQRHPLLSASIKQPLTLELEQQQSECASGIEEDGDVFVEDQLSPSPFHSQQLSSHFGDWDEGAVEIRLQEVLRACWAIMKGVAVFQLAAFLGPIVTDQNKAMVYGSTAKGSFIEPYYPQLVELAKLAGSMLGSQFIPVYHPRRPKAMLLAMSAAMLLFFAAFGLAMHFKGGAAVMLLLVALEYTAGGHLNSTAFTLAKDSMHPDDSRMAQMVLALTAALGCWIAHCLSWLWVVIPVP